MPSWTPEQLREYENRSAIRHAKPQPIVQHAQAGEAQGEQESAARIKIRFTRFSRWIIPDRTNLEGGIKYLEDALIYAGIIPGDSEAEITRTISQVKVKTKAEERTEIELI